VEEFLKVPIETRSTHIKLARVVDIAMQEAKMFWEFIHDYHYAKHGRGAMTVWFDYLEEEWPLMDGFILIQHLYYFNRKELAKRHCYGAIKHVDMYDPEKCFVLLVAGGIKGRSIVPTQVITIDKD
jgi:hypothetical protein